MKIYQRCRKKAEIDEKQIESKKYLHIYNDIYMNYLTMLCIFVIQKKNIWNKDDLWKLYTDKTRRVFEFHESLA